MAAPRRKRPKPSLRQEQKAQTRQRIVDAARQVFYHGDYFGATVDQIVEAAGIGRQTFYFHFSDKEEVLTQLITDYNARGAAIMERLPGPRPTLDELRDWVIKLADFLESEKASYFMLHQLSHNPHKNHDYGRSTIDLWIATLGRRAPAFAAAATKSRATARAWRLIVDLTWSGTMIWTTRDSKFAAAVLTTVAQSLHDFLRDPEFAKSQKKKHPPNR